MVCMEKGGGMVRVGAGNCSVMHGEGKDGKSRIGKDMGTGI